MMKEKIDASELINKFKKPLLNLAVIIAALIISLRIYSGQEKKINTLKLQRESEVKRNLALEDIGRLELQLSSYKKFLNKKDASSAIKKLGEIAKASSVKIISIRPENIKDGAYYTVYPFGLTVSAENYHVLGKFISELEKSPDVYTVNSLSIKPQGSSMGGESAGLQVGMQVSTYLYKD